MKSASCRLRRDARDAVTEVPALDPIPPDVRWCRVGSPISNRCEAVPIGVSEALRIELLDESGCSSSGGATVACLLLVEFERDTAAAARGVVATQYAPQAAVTTWRRVNRAGLEQLWRVPREASPALARLPPTQRSLQLIEDGCVPLDALGALCRRAEGGGGSSRHSGRDLRHAGDGTSMSTRLPIHARRLARDLRGLFDDATELLLRLGGVPSGEHGVAGCGREFWSASTARR